MYNDKQQREIFHLLFLERLLKISDPKLYAVKGGCNLRFFFNSPRYSEDLDLDVFGGSVDTHKKNGYKILNDSAFKRVLQAYGIQDILINDPAKAKQSQTTQRFRCRLVNASGESFPTKVEYSRREEKPTNVVLDPIDPQRAHIYKRRSFESPHYTGKSAIIQKIYALANRTEIQARDPFDIYMLFLSGYANDLDLKDVPSETLSKAANNLTDITFEYFYGQVVDYLDIEFRDEFSKEAQWKKIKEKVLKLIHV